MKTVLYYFSATGNSLNLAKDIAKELEQTEIISIPQLSDNTKIIPPCERIGIIFPVYDWGAPKFIRNFIKTLDLTNVKYIFAITHCNYLPGLALEHINDELRLKGKELSSGFIIKMPGNYIPLYGANSPKAQQKKFSQKDKKINKIIEIVKNDRKVPPERSRFIFDRLFSSAFQKQMEKFASSDSNFCITEKCNGCGICKKVCAFKNIELSDNKPKWQHKCEQCMACIHLCPQEAIQYGTKSQSKKRYRNPHITLQEIIKSNEKI